MEIYTSYFAKHRRAEEDTAYISIAVARPKYGVAYPIRDASTLKPYGVFGRCSDEEFEEKYRKRLDRIGVQRIWDEISGLGLGYKKVMLLCHEKDADVCHRRMFARWWKEKTGMDIQEYGVEPKREEKPDNQIDMFSVLF